MKYCNLILILFLCSFTFTFVSCEKKSETKGTVEEPVSSLDSVISRGAKFEIVTDVYKFDTAGSPLYVNGEIYFTNNNFNPPEKSLTIKMDASGAYELLRKNNGVTTAMRHSGKVTIYCCEMLGHRVIEMGRNGKVLRIVCDSYNGKRIDGPNDLIVDRQGGIYFTDSQFIGDQEKMQETPAVYYVKPDGSVVRVIDDIEFPNGIALSPDEKTLYVANTPGKYLLAYDVLPDGTVTNKRNFVELQLSEENSKKGSETGGADGMAVDSAGNIFVATTQGLGIQVFNSRGDHLGNIPCPTATNNCNFGGDDLKTLYISALDGIYRIPVKIPGLKQPQS